MQNSQLRPEAIVGFYGNLVKRKFIYVECTIIHVVAVLTEFCLIFVFRSAFGYSL